MGVNTFGGMRIPEVRSASVLHPHPHSRFTRVGRSLVVLAGRSVRFVARLRGGGSALPGLVVERLSPHFVRNALAELPEGVILVSGTNGKTTTTKILVELLRSQGLRVFTNPSGSNFSRGIASALLGAVSLDGRLEADIAVLELDEAHGARFVREVPPRYAVLLNVHRDQLDRFAEIDSTARFLTEIADATRGALILNREDVRIASIARGLPGAKVRYFGLCGHLLGELPTDDDLHGAAGPLRSGPPADVLLTDYRGSVATFQVGGRRIDAPLRLPATYNAYNAAAALTAVRAVRHDELDVPALVEALTAVTPAFGRGEVLIVDGSPLELVLVKNPVGFRLGLASFTARGYATMIAVNDNDADGRDMSWLWDVPFGSLRSDGVAVVCGTRAHEMALRLQYDGVAVGQIEPDIPSALRSFRDGYRGAPKRIFCTYTAMLALRRAVAEDARSVLAA